MRSPMGEEEVELTTPQQDWCDRGVRCLCLALSPPGCSPVLRRYIFTQASLKAHLAQAAKTKALLQQAQSGEEGVDRARWENPREGGAGGLEGMTDKYASTRGDH